MINLDQILLNADPYSFTEKDKKKYFLYHMKKLNNHHIKNCEGYKKIMKFISYKEYQYKEICDLPFLPSAIFKNHNLKSIKKNENFKEIYSSGTSSQNKSKIFLDSFNAKNQIVVLNRLFSKIIGKNRLPIIFAEQDPSNNKIKNLNAKTSAIYGFSMFSSDKYFLLNKENRIDYDGLNKFLEKYYKKKFLIFGFTSSIYQNLILHLDKKKLKFSMSNSQLIHGGGWKKLLNLSISNSEFKSKLNHKLGIQSVINYYGVVEQTGSIFFESNKCGYFHTSVFSDVLIRDSKLNVEKNGNEGLVQLVSLLPTSYPGHNILTEDVGKIIGQDDCSCGLKGKYFLIKGRAKEAELRGCSDV
jgi:hypothetical protein